MPRSREYWSNWYREQAKLTRLKNPAKAIYWDTRANDKGKGFHFPLSVQEIENIISVPCSYCGESKLRLTLDRIDNTKGHTLDNVVCSCIRCNLLRRDMPYEAWLELRSGLKSAREKNLFRGWTGCLKNVK